MTAATGRRTRQDADSAIRPRTRPTKQSARPANARTARIRASACRSSRFRCD